MIKKPTTLVLGAGASVPFGFPTGFELLQRVLEQTGSGQTQSFFEVLSSLRCNRKLINTFRESLLRSGKKSVDSFLEHRPDFVRIGKAVMAATLIGFENEALLHERHGKSWYEYLFGFLATTFENFDKNKLSILTFNYDRSLEYFLLAALQHSYGRYPNECARKLSAIPIIHLHGDLGGVPFVGKKSVRPYSNKLTVRDVRLAAKRIRIVHESTRDEPQFERARKILSESKTICFLGFGYLEQNIQRLGFDSVNSYPASVVYGSTLGLTAAEQNHARRLFHNRLILSKGPSIGCDVLSFLRETGILQLASQD